MESDDMWQFEMDLHYVKDRVEELLSVKRQKGPNDDLVRKFVQIPKFAKSAHFHHCMSLSTIDIHSRLSRRYTKLIPMPSSSTERCPLIRKH
mmetsp:Transcript_19089/g.32690  ORF Transcript_19089/g.32690 Transcript_19089/m.32690 type:complete len:92 (-) Transcript_19089:493-768(-)